MLRTRVPWGSRGTCTSFVVLGAVCAAQNCARSILARATVLRRLPLPALTLVLVLVEVEADVVLAVSWWGVLLTAWILRV